MNWIPFQERWPNIRTEDDSDTEVIVRSENFKGERTAKYSPFIGDWRLSDCVHPMQNCYFTTERAEWLDD